MRAGCREPSHHVTCVAARVHCPDPADGGDHCHNPSLSNNAAALDFSTAPAPGDALPGIKALLAVVVPEWLLMVAGQRGVRGGTLRLLFDLSRGTVKSYCGREKKDRVDTSLVYGELFLSASKKSVVLAQLA